MDGVNSESLRRGAPKKTWDTTKFMPHWLNVEISEHYEIDREELGAGGFGKVFIARDKKYASREVCIKKVIVQNPESLQSLRREAKIMKDLTHPNICKLYELYEAQRFVFFVMEYLSGKEVFDRIMEDGFISEKITAQVVSQAASALKHAHSKMIAHRDMKPENLVFVDNDREKNLVKVIDWGLGAEFGGLRMKTQVGSLTYAAPEVLDGRGGSYGAPCDIWSVGVIAYVMMSGKPPFWGNQSQQVAVMRQERYPMAGPEWDSVSAAGKDFVKRLLKNRPEERMTIDEVLAHPWIEASAAGRAQVNPEIVRGILTNMKKFSSSSQFFVVCASTVARNLDMRSLSDIHDVFTQLDTNRDGVLTLSEVKEGFVKMFGAEDSELEKMFEQLDLDSNGTLDYTEFCAAGIGERMISQEEALWAAFKGFDKDGSGKLSIEEVRDALTVGDSADIQKQWKKGVCDEVASNVMTIFDKDGSGSIEFEEWLLLMRKSAAEHELQWETPASDRDAEYERNQLQRQLAEANQESDAAKAKHAVYNMLDMKRCDGACHAGAGCPEDHVECHGEHGGDDGEEAREEAAEQRGCVVT